VLRSAQPARIRCPSKAHSLGQSIRKSVGCLSYFRPGARLSGCCAARQSDYWRKPATRALGNRLAPPRFITRARPPRHRSRAAATDRRWTPFEPTARLGARRGCAANDLSREPRQALRLLIWRIADTGRGRLARQQRRVGNLRSKFTDRPHNQRVHFYLFTEVPKDDIHQGRRRGGDEFKGDGSVRERR
jgi:hypothetical protein